MQQPGILHRYAPKLVAFEHTPAPNKTETPTKSKPNDLLLWIGGLGDGLLTVEYPSKIAARLPSSWSVVEVLISSSYEGWRTGSLARDAVEIHECVKYFRSQPDGSDRRIVLMGHSTGCQDIMEYLVGRGSGGRLASWGEIDGIILQGGVSDREAAAMEAKDAESQRKLQAVIEEAKRLIDAGRENDIVSRDGHPLVGQNDPGVSAYRTYSLLARGGDDDYFSSDLAGSVIRRNFGDLATTVGAVMFLLGEVDQYVPDHVDKYELIDQWTNIILTQKGSAEIDLGGVVLGASHNLNGDPENVVQDLVGRVVKFIENIDHKPETDGRGRRVIAVVQSDDMTVKAKKKAHQEGRHGKDGQQDIRDDGIIDKVSTAGSGSHGALTESEEEEVWFSAVETLTKKK